MRRQIAYTLIIFFSIVSIFPLVNMANAQAQTTVSLDPQSLVATSPNQVFTLNITISNVQNLWGWAVNVTWDSRYLTLMNKQEGNFLSDQVDNTQFAPLPVLDINYTHNDQETANSIGMKCLKLACSAASWNNGVQDSASGSGVLATLTFQIIKQTTATPITLSVENLLQPNPVASDNAVVGAHEIITPVSYISTTQVSLILAGPPTANAGRDQTVQQGMQVIFNASQSVSSGNDTTYAWTFLDETPQNLTGKITTYTFNKPGNYSVTLTVQDSLGSDNCTVAIHVLGGLATPTPTVTSAPSDDPNSTSTSTASPSASAAAASSDPTQNEATFNLPPTILGVLVVLTIFVFSGSFFWLKKQM